MSRKQTPVLNPTYKGYAISSLIPLLQEFESLIRDMEIVPDAFEIPSIMTREQYISEGIKLYCNECVAIRQEIERRRNLIVIPRLSTDKEIIQTLKDRVPVADVLEWYTEVIFTNRTLKFRCTLHGEDKTPSGIIYEKEQRFWCFGCNKGGDIFDAVCLFERVDLPKAIAKLANHIGLDTKPIIPHPPVPVRGGIKL